MFKTESTIYDQALAANFDYGVVLRGRKYHEKGNVWDITISHEGRHITSRVKGRGRTVYRTDIDIVKEDYSEGVDVEGVCSCTVGFNCKHVVATLLEAKAQVPQTLSRGNIIPIEREAPPTSTDFTRWFQSFQSTVHRSPIHIPPAIDSYHLLYVLQPSSNHSRKLEIRLKISKVLKNGGYGKPKKYSPMANSQQAYLQSVDEEIIAGLQFLNKHTFSFQQSSYCITLEGHQGSKWLEMILHTERCFWEDAPKQPLTWGEKKALAFQWELLPNASQSLKLFIDEKPAELFILDTLWYVDTTQKQCGPVETDIPVYVVEKLLEAPPIPPERAEELSQQIKAVTPRNELLPIPLNKPITKIDVEVIPEMRLTVEPLLISKENAYGYCTPHTMDAAIAEIFFNYAGRAVPFSSENNTDTLTYIEDGIVYATKRDFEKEKSTLLGLQEHMQLEVLNTPQETNKATKLIITSIHDEEDFLHFSLYTLPQLEYNGWRITRAHDAFLKLLYEEDISWYSELDEESEYDYFKFTMGIMVDNEKINILPIIAEIMQSTPIDHFKDFPDDRTIPLPLPNGRLLSVPYARIKPILNILVELYDVELGEVDALKLSKRQAALLFEIEKAFQASQLRWFGGERLRRLGRKLSEFTAIKKVPPPKTFLAILRNYQQDGVNWLQFLREYQLGGILADDMGLGKTVQTLAHMSIEKNRRRMKKPSLIIAPTSLMTNWQQEAKRFTPHLKVLVYHGDNRHAHKDSIPQYDLVLTTYPLLLRDKNIHLSNAYYYLILDEAQFIKNHKAKSTQVVQQIKAEHRLCLTGTPMENHLGELWSLFHFLMPGLLGDVRQFKRLFRTPIEKHNDEDRRKGLILRVKPFMLRRKKNAVLKELPEKTEIIRRVELQGPERDLYESIRLSMERKVRDAIKKKGLARSHIIILDALLKLRQTCCHPRLLKLASAKKAYKYSAKMALLKEMLPSMVEEGRKILLFSQFTTLLELIEEMLQKEGLEYVKLTGATKNRAKPIASFQNGRVSIFLISLKAGGTGLNLTAADTVIHYDPWWNPAVEDQATDRAHRIGQKKSVFVYKLLASGTVEETILEMQQKKRQLMEGLFSEQSHGKLNFSSEDLKNLFKPLEVF